MGKTKSKVKKKKRRMLDAAIKNGTPPSKVLGKKWIYWSSMTRMRNGSDLMGNITHREVDPVEDFFRVKNRDETIRLLKKFYKKGYRYVVRGPEDVYLALFSVKPKKYRSFEDCGYINEDDPKAKPCQLIKNTDITEIRWQNRYPTVISEFVKGDELSFGK